MIRIVLDTNVWLSGLLWGGIPRQVIELCETRRIEIICSDEILDMARERSTFVITKPVTVVNLRDPKDSIVIATAIAGQCSMIVSGDDDLLVLGTVFGIEIVTPRDFMTIA